MPTEEYDLFISYADADREWVEGYLLDALRQAGVNYHLEAAFALGAPRIAEFNRAIEQSKRTLLVLSPTYLPDPDNQNNQFADLLAQSYGRETGTWPVIPLILRPVKLPTNLSMLVPLRATNRDEWEEAIERLCAELQRPVPASGPKPDCPYPGMVPFSEANSDRFFGRDQEVQELLNRLRLHPFITVIGPSGSGKSSLVFAGLIPKLIHSRLLASGEWLVRSIRPSETPLATLETALGGELTNLALAVRNALATQLNAQQLLLVVDQFEEVFTLAGEEAVPFQETLLRLVETPHCYVILTVRADFYSELMESFLWQQIQSYRLELVPLDEIRLHEAIIRPAEKVGVFIEPTLVERLVADAGQEPGVLPLIQETMVLLWEKVERRFLPFRAYDTLVLNSPVYKNLDGSNRTGLQAAIANRADYAVVHLPEKQRQIARRIFLRLIQFGEGRADTRRQQSVEQLRTSGDDAYLLDQTLLYLADCRLLTLSSGEDDCSKKVDIAHEALIEGWPALQWWLQERREAEQTRRRLVRQAKEWVRLGKSYGGLLDEVELAEARRWLSSADAEELGNDETLLELVEVSDQAIQDAKEREEAARQRESKLLQERLKTAQTRNTIATISVVVLTALVAIAVDRSIRSQFNAIEALSESSSTHLVSHQELEALVTSVKAGRQLQNPILRFFMTFVPATDIRIKTIGSLQQAVYQTQEINRLEGHSQRILSVSFCSNQQEKIIASASDDGTIRLWEPDGSPAIPEPLNHKPRVTSVVLSPDCSMLVSASTDGTVNLWNRNDSQWLSGALEDGELAQGKAHDDWVSSVAFSHDGEILATASRQSNNDQTVKLWNITNGKGKLIHRLPYNSSVNDVSFSPDGRILASAGSDQTVRLWDTTKGTSIQEPIEGHKDYVTSVRFSSKGQFLASTSSDSTVKLWKVTNGVVQTPEWQTLDEPEDQVTSICFSPDGKFLAAASEDSNLWLWLLTDENIPSKKTLSGHSSEIWSVSCSPDNKTLISTGEDKTIRTWSIPPLKENTSIELDSVSFSLDGKTLAMADRDGSIRLCPREQISSNSENTAIGWQNCVDSSLEKEKETLLKNPNGVTSLIVSPDKKTLASIDIDGNYQTIRLWDSVNGSPIGKPLMGHQDSVTSLSFSPDSKILASGSEDTTIRLWNAADSTLIGKPLRGHQEGVTSISFSPDSKILASGDLNGTIKLWRSDGTLLRTLDRAEEKHNLEIAALSFSPDGKTLVSASWDNTIKLWRVSDGTLLHNLTEHQNGVTSISFHPDGKTIVSGSADQTIRLWNSTEGTLLKTLVGHSARVDSVQFSTDGKTLMSIDQYERVLLWDFSLDSLLEHGCKHIQDYLQTNPNVSDSDRRICPKS